MHLLFYLICANHIIFYQITGKIIQDKFKDKNVIYFDKSKISEPTNFRFTRDNENEESTEGPDKYTAPKIKYFHFGHDDMSFGALHYSDEYPSCYILLLMDNMYPNEVKTSFTYYTNNYGETWNEKQFGKNGEKHIINVIHFEKKSIFASATNDKTIYFSQDCFTKTTILKHHLDVKQIFVNPFNVFNSALSTKDGRGYIMTFTRGDQNSLLLKDVNCTFVAKFLWLSDGKTVLILCKEKINSEIFFLRKIITDEKSIDFYDDILTNVVDIQVRDNIIYAEVFKNKTLELYIKKNGNDIVQAHFPKSLDPINFYISGVTNNQIVAIVSHLKDGNYMDSLFSADLNDLKFVMILMNVTTEWRIKEGIKKVECHDVISFELIPGLLLVKGIHDGTKEFKSKTMISTTGGVHWDEVQEIAHGDNGCLPPDCDFDLMLSCSHENGHHQPVVQVSSAPYLLIAKGTRHHKSETNVHSHMYVSTDGGFSWERGKVGKYVFTILDHGGIIVALEQYGKKLYYSYDEGMSWRFTNLEDILYYPLLMLHQEDGNHLDAYSFGFSFGGVGWKFVGVNFKEILKTKCKDSDYGEFTPGMNHIQQCFQGQKNFMYKRKKNVMCKSTINELPPISPVSCKCNKNDFGCAFNFFMKDNQCIPDPFGGNHSEEVKCNIGDFSFLESKYVRIHGDKCIKGEGLDEVAELCGLTELDEGIIVRSKSSFFLFTGKTIESRAYYFIKLPFYLQYKITSYDFDILNKCLYFLTDEGIRRVCWNSRDHVLYPRAEVILMERNLHDIQIEPQGRNLYFHDGNKIFLLSIDGKFRKIISDHIDAITCMKIDHHNKRLTWAAVQFSNGKQINTFTTSNLEGEEKKNFLLKTPAISISYSSEDGNYHLVQENRVTYDLISAKSGNIVEKRFPKSGVTSIDHFKNYLIKMYNGEIMIDQKVINFPNLEEMYIFHSTIKEKTCFNNRCSHICVPLTSIEDKCTCPNGMNLEKDKCVCPDYNPNCNACKTHEFQCTSGECAPAGSRCNGVLQCEDGSDEDGCPKVCEIDEFMCLDHSKCIDLSQLCDGSVDCQDGSDEKDCKPRNICHEFQFKCDNGKCILESLVCNKIDECGDGSDEENCESEKCLNIEFQCTDGTCIPKNKVCDGIFDCSDKSDETDCDKELKPSNCTFVCDGGKCLPPNNVCDHFTDCKDKTDELNCGYSINCNHGSSPCHSETYCYSNLQKCNSINECNNNNDEENCLIGSCEHPFVTKCLKGEECGRMNSLCDPRANCKKDFYLKPFCESDKQITEISVNKINPLAPIITFKSPNSKHTSFTINVKKWLSTDEVRTYSTKENFFIIPDLSHCNSYIVYIESHENPGIGQIINIVPKLTHYFPPKNFHYDSKDSKLKWKRTMPHCYPVEYYIECDINDQSEKLRVFSKQEVFIKKRPKSCKIATCPMNAFNISCSAFEEIIYKRSLIGIWILFSALVIISIIIGCYALIRKRHTIFNRFGLQNKSFRPMSAIQASTDSRMLLGESDEEDFENM